MDTELLYRAKLQEIEREAQRVRLVANAKKTLNRPGASEPERRCLPIPSRLLRRACRQAGALRPAS